MNRNHAAFTLVELMIVVAVLAILTVIALPNYLEAMRQGRRADAIAALLHLQQAQEFWRSGHDRYATLAELGLAGASPDGFYRITVADPDAAGYRATAAPRVGGPQEGDGCGTFAVHQDGPDHSGDFAGARCWKR